MDYSLYGLGAAYRGMVAAQAALNTVGNNLANANTEGYSRQRVEQVPAASIMQYSFNTPVSLAQMGGGVQVTSIKRVRDDFLDMQVRYETATLGANETMRDQVNQIEGLFQEPGEYGLSAVMTKFFNAWDQLAVKADDSAARSEVREQGVTLANTFNAMHRNLVRMRADLDAQIQRQVADINGLTSQVSALNQQIAASGALGTQSNSLMDQRDALLEKLSKITSIQTSLQPDGKMYVYMKGRGLVDSDRAELLTTAANAEGNLSEVAFRGVVIPPMEIGGSLGALFSARDEVIGRSKAEARPGTPVLPDTPNGVLYQLDVLANELAQKVNAYHTTGTDLSGTMAGTPFFVNNNPYASVADNTFIGVQGFLVNLDIQNGTPGLDKIVAGRPTDAARPTVPGPGDNEIAQKIASIRSEAGFGHPTQTLSDYYRTFLSNLGVVGQSANRTAVNQTNLIDHLHDQRESVSGVSFDQEMSDLVRYQHAYNASAKVLTMFDEVLDRLINGVAPGR
ncbi:MAG TPA: flagellar hook-associated protein FlgK [Pantanalinema sp.]